MLNTEVIKTRIELFEEYLWEAVRNAKWDYLDKDTIINSLEVTIEKVRDNVL